jgi:glycosyltransferase involved in cell wall biosynthesis
MKLLLITQKIDSSDTVLGFFTGWVSKFSNKFESVEVICLEKNLNNPDFVLPQNVTVYSLGKEGGLSKIQYVRNFYNYLSLISGTYDCVFVHMNQEYILLAGLYWKIKKIPVYFWRNHSRGSFLTRIAVYLSTKVFCTSTKSFTARFKKTKIMPVGVDTNIFKSVSTMNRKKYSVLMVGRISPVKNIDLALNAVKNLVEKGIQVSLSIIGDPINREEDKKYYDSLKNFVSSNNLSQYVQFLPAVPYDRLGEIYSSFEICLNLTTDGSFDKTIVEAAACGIVPLVSNKSLVGILPEACITDRDVESISSHIQDLFDASVRVSLRSDLEKFVLDNNLDTLMDKISIEVQS